jgi:hypothetical protein
MTDQAALEANNHPLRERHRPTHFFWRGDRYPFNRLEDGVTFARLDPYCIAPQAWKLLNGRTIYVTGSDVRDISKQVHDLDLPDTRPLGVGDWDEQRIASLEDRVAALEAALSRQREPAASQSDPRDQEIADLKASVAELAEKLKQAETPPPLSPEPAAAGPELPNGDEKLVDWKDALSPEELRQDAERILQNFIDGFDVADEIAGMSAVRREQLTKELHSDKAKLARARMAGANPDQREEAIDRLVGLLARRGV